MSLDLTNKAHFISRESKRKILGLDLISSSFAGWTEASRGEVLSCPQVDRVHVYTVYKTSFSSDLERARDTGLAITSLQPGMELLLWPSLRLDTITLKPF